MCDLSEIAEDLFNGVMLFSRQPWNRAWIVNPDVLLGNTRVWYFNCSSPKLPRLITTA